MSEETVLGLPH